MYIGNVCEQIFVYVIEFIPYLWYKMYFKVTLFDNQIETSEQSLKGNNLSALWSGQGWVKTIYRIHIVVSRVFQTTLQGCAAPKAGVSLQYTNCLCELQS